MKSGASRAVVLSAVSVLLLFAIVPLVFKLMFSRGDDALRDSFRDAKPTGETLKISTLAAGERIVVDHIRHGDDGPAEGNSYVIGGGEEKSITEIERTVEWKKEWGPVLTGSGRATTYPMNGRQQRGLDVYLEYLRKRRDFMWQYPDTYELTYFRNGREIGSEKLIDIFRLSISTKREAYEDLDSYRRSFFKPEEWNVVLPFRDLLIELEIENDQIGEIPLSQPKR